MSAEQRTALVAGATGLVGNHLLAQLLKEPAYGRVTAFVRRPIPASDPKLNPVIVDFDALTRWADQARAEDVFCTLGTTIRKAGSEEAFRKVDYSYPLQLARLAVSKGAKQFIVVTSVGANPNSSNFYLRTKGQLEEDLKNVGFKTLWILRPSFLAGRRDESRSGEHIGLAVFRVISPLMAGKLSKYRPIAASKVAAAMMKAAKKASSGVHILESDEIDEIGEVQKE